MSRDRVGDVQPERSTPALFREYLRALVGALSWRVGLALGLMIGGGLGEGIGFVLLIPLLRLVGLDVQEGGVGRIAETVNATFAMFGVRPTLPGILGVFAVVTGAQALLVRWQTLVNRRLEYEFAQQLRERLFDAIVHTRWVFFSRQRQPDLAHALTAEVDRVGTATQYLLSALATAIVAAVYLGLAFRISAPLTILVASLGAILVLALVPQVRRAPATGQGMSIAGSRLYAAALDHLGGMKTVKSYGAESRTAAVFAEATGSQAARFLAAVRNYADVRLLFDVGTLVLLCVSLLTAIEWLNLPAASILLLIFLFGRTMPRAASVQQNVQHFVNALAAFGTVRGLEDRCRADRAPDMQAGHLPRFERAVQLVDVDLAYDRDRTALSGVSLAIDAGRTTAVVGPSGAGKSTVADLVLGLVVPDRGSVWIDDEPLGDDTCVAWRARIGYVTQDTFLFNGTVRENLRWASPDATDDRMRAALQAAAADFVWGWPNGLDTQLGERGVAMSGGERQRIALARALLREPALLVLDEATSNVDAENERRILQAIAGLRGRVTILVITHRLATVKDADTIYVMDEGRVVESGTWAQLTANPTGRLSALWEAQRLD